MEQHPLEIIEGSVRCPDGQRIPLEQIHDVTAPRILIGVDPSLAPGEARSGSAEGAAVVVKYRDAGSAGPPLVKMIPVGTFNDADSLVLEIQKARKALRSGSGEKTVVGQCEKCGRDLRVKANAVRPSMTLTCKCGHLNKVQGPTT